MGRRLKRYAARRDLAEPAIVDALVAVGANVIRLNQPVDLLVRFRNTWHVLEVKTPKKRPDKRQQAQREFCLTNQVPYVRTPAEALKAIGATQ